jgi:hypothetical protein
MGRAAQAKLPERAPPPPHVQAALGRAIQTKLEAPPLPPARPSPVSQTLQPAREKLPTPSHPVPRVLPCPQPAPGSSGIVQRVLDERKFAAALRTAEGRPKRGVMILVGRYNLMRRRWEATVGTSPLVLAEFRAAKDRLLETVGFDDDLRDLVTQDFAVASVELKLVQNRIADLKQRIRFTEPSFETDIKAAMRKVDLAKRQGFAKITEALEALAKVVEESEAITAEMKGASVVTVAAAPVAVAEVKAPRRVSGWKGHGTYIPPTDPDFCTGPVGFAIVKITGAGDGVRAEMIGTVGKGGDESTPGPSEAYYKKVAYAGAKPFPRQKHGEDDWFVQHTARLDLLRGATRIEVLDSAVPCADCTRLYIQPLRTFMAGVPVYVYTFRDDHNSGLGRVVYEVTSGGLEHRGTWSE